MRKTVIPTSWYSRIPCRQTRACRILKKPSSPPSFRFSPYRALISAQALPDFCPVADKALLVYPSDESRAERACPLSCAAVSFVLAAASSSSRRSDDFRPIPVPVEMATPQQWYQGLPPLTRYWLTAAVVTGFACRFGALPLNWLHLDWTLILTKLQVRCAQEGWSATAS